MGKATRKRTVKPYVDEEPGTHNEGDIGILKDFSDSVRQVGPYLVRALILEESCP